MLKTCVIVLIINLWCLNNNVECAPQSQYYRSFDANNLVADEPVKYHGAQLWNIPFDSELTRNTIIGLQDEFG
jgi:hypothetical protein